MKKMNLKQMVKSNKKNRRRGADRETELQNRGHRERQSRNKNEKKNPSILAAFSLLFFKKTVKLTGRGKENTKARVLIFSLRAPPGPLKLA